MEKIDIEINFPDLGKLILDINHMRPSMVEMLIDEYDSMMLECADNTAIVMECKRVLDRLYEIRGSLRGE